jgi:hypothetical protein
VIVDIGHGATWGSAPENAASSVSVFSYTADIAAVPDGASNRADVLGVQIPDRVLVGLSIASPPQPLTDMSHLGGGPFGDLCAWR